MSDLRDRVATTRPDHGEVRPVDFDDIVRRGRRQRLARRGGAAAGILGLVAAVAVTSISFPDPIIVDPVTAAPTTTGSTTPVDGDGSVLAPLPMWAVADLPTAGKPTPFLGATTDGRLVMLGTSGYAAGDIEGGEVDAGLLDGGVFDPATATWSTFPALTGYPNMQGGQFIDVHLQGDRLVVLTSGPGGVSGAWIAVDGEAWTSIPTAPDVQQFPDATAFDGDTIAIVQTGTRDDRPVQDPVVARFSLDEATWAIGAAPPFPVHEYPETAVQSANLVVHAGRETSEKVLVVDEGDEFVPGSFDNTWLYDVTADTWQQLPRSPLEDGLVPTIGWLDDQTIVALGRTMSSSSNGTSDPRDVAALLDVPTGTWSTIDPPSDLEGSGLRIQYAPGARGMTAGPLLAVRGGDGSYGEVTPFALLDPETRVWISGPDTGGKDVRPFDDTWLAFTTGGRDSAIPMGVSILRDGVWVPVEGGPADRLEHSVVTIGDALYVVGGQHDFARVADDIGILRP